MEPSTFFTVQIHGQLDAGLIPDADNLYAKVSFVHGPDWVVISGLEEGITQISKSCTQPTSDSDVIQQCVWNFPLEIGYKSTNVYGWPQLVVSVYGIDSLGRDVVRGYTSIRVPRKAGRCTVYVPTFTPIASSPLNGFLSWLTGRRPEYLDSKFVSKSDGREVTRVKSSGSIKLSLNIMIRDMDKYGYKV